MLAPDRVKSRKPLVGTPKPRLAPPVPANADVKPFVKLASDLGLELFPWQRQAARYLVAKDTKGFPLYREVCVVVARQNGKTSLLRPLVVGALLAGKRVMHAAQHLRLPGEFHRELAEVFETQFPECLPARRGISWRAGQEEIRTNTGGVYQIVAATGGAPRGPSNDLVIIDEIRELTDDRFIAGIKPTIIAKASAQIVYLSNAGTKNSVVLNSLRARAEDDPRLAYLEWSAEPGRLPDDSGGWLEANPAIGHKEGLFENIADEYRAAHLGGSMASFETEHLCRWVITDDDLLVTGAQWAGQEFGALGQPVRPVMAVKMDIAGERAAAVVAWLLPDSRVALAVVADVTGSPIHVPDLGPALVAKATEWRASTVAFDPYTDTDLVRYFRRSEKVMGRDYANASEGFARRVAARQFVVDDEAGALARDLEHTTRHHGERGTWIAVKSDQPNPVAEAAIRAAWLASKPSNFEIARIF